MMGELRAGTITIARLATRQGDVGPMKRNLASDKRAAIVSCQRLDANEADLFKAQRNEQNHHACQHGHEKQQADAIALTL